MVVRPVNSCALCLAARTAVGKMVGFTPGQVVDLGRSSASFDAQVDALAKLARTIRQERGHADPAPVQALPAPALDA